MESALISAIYTRPYVASSPKQRVEVRPMTTLQVAHVLLRFQLGRDTYDDRNQYVGWKDIDPETFVAKNGIDLISSLDAE